MAGSPAATGRSLVAAALVLGAACSPATVAGTAVTRSPAPVASAAATPAPTASADTQRPTPSPPPRPTPPPPSAPAIAPPDPSLAIDSLDDVADAVIRVEADGDAYDPILDERFDAWQGSGFVIHSDGTAVTNSHVVSGADTLTAFVTGGTQAVPVELVGIDPCSDLAVVRLSGSGYPWLRWVDDLHAPDDVTAFGHPDGNRDVVVTDGEVHMSSDEGANPRSAVEAALSTSVELIPGGSGGPLVDDDAAVVGVMYAFDPFDPTLGLAVSHEEAEPAVRRIRRWFHPADLGIDGFAGLSEVVPVAGIEVIDVVPRSPAARSGMRKGDVVTHLGGVRVGRDLTMLDFCSVLRGHQGPSPLTATVVRAETGDIHEGPLGRGRLPAVDELDGHGMRLLPVPEQHDHVTYNYVSVSDASGTLHVELPAMWADVESPGTWRDDAPPASLSASADLARFAGSSTTPGVSIVASAERDAFDLRAAQVGLPDLRSRCDLSRRYPLRTERQRGRFAVHTTCFSTGDTVVTAVLRPRDGAGSALVAMQLRSPRDVEALDRVIDSLELRVSP